MFFKFEKIFFKKFMLFLLLHVPYSIPSVGDCCGEYSLYCNVSGGIFHRGGFPLPSPEGIRI